MGKTNQSIETIDELSLYVFGNSSIGNGPLFRNLDKIPKHLVDKMKLVKSEELNKVRIDHIFTDKA